MGSMMQDLAFAIPGVDEAMSFAEIMKCVEFPFKNTSLLIMHLQGTSSQWSTLLSFLILRQRVTPCASYLSQQFLRRRWASSAVSGRDLGL